MKFIVGFAAVILAVACQTSVSSKIQTDVKKQILENSKVQNINKSPTSIRKIDFQNFTFPWTKTFSGKEKSFTLRNGIAELQDKRKLSFKSLSYINAVDNYEEQAIVVIKIDDGNAVYEMLYVFAIENNIPKLLESFEFGENNISFGTAFVAHGELVIETYHQLAGDAECCPSVIEVAYYKWQKDKFVLQSEPQKVLNGYVDRIKKE